MRLIDADKLLRFFTIDTANQTYRFGTIKKQIENAETVQAIPIPDNATNGDMIEAMFPNLKGREKAFAIELNVNKNKVGNISVDWWNAPYEEKER